MKTKALLLLGVVALMLPSCVNIYSQGAYQGPCGEGGYYPQSQQWGNDYNQFGHQQQYGGQCGQQWSGEQRMIIHRRRVTKVQHYPCGRPDCVPSRGRMITRPYYLP